MSNMKRSMRRVFWLLALCFFLLLGYLGKLVFVDREEISGNSYNSRLRYVDETIKETFWTERARSSRPAQGRRTVPTRENIRADGWRHILQATAVSGKPALRQQKILS